MLAELLALFTYEASAAGLLREVRWAGGLRCPYCRSDAVIRWAWYRRVYQRYRCKACRRTFNDKTGTVFAYSRVPLNEWLFLSYLLACLHVSILRVSRELERSYGVVYRSARRAMNVIHRGKPSTGSNRLSGTVEMDEVYLTAGLKGRGNRRRIECLGRRPRRRGLRGRPGRGSWKVDRPPIVVLVERRGRERYVPSTDVEGETVGRIASRHVEPGSKTYTDGFPSYAVLPSLGFDHDWVNHSEGEYARGDVHVNNCENRCSLLRPWLAVHRGISKDNLGAYLSLFQFQRTTSQLPSLQRLKLILRLKNPPTTFLSKSVVCFFCLVCNSQVGTFDVVLI